MFFFLIFFWGGEDLDVGVCLPPFIDEHTSDFKTGMVLARK